MYIYIYICESLRLTFVGLASGETNQVSWYDLIVSFLCGEAMGIQPKLELIIFCFVFISEVIMTLFRKNLKVVYVW